MRDREEGHFLLRNTAPTRNLRPNEANSLLHYR